MSITRIYGDDMVEELTAEQIVGLREQNETIRLRYDDGLRLFAHIRFLEQKVIGAGN